MRDSVQMDGNIRACGRAQDTTVFLFPLQPSDKEATNFEERTRRAEQSRVGGYH
jgi:hypothetical protein